MNFTTPSRLTMPSSPEREWAGGRARRRAGDDGMLVPSQFYRADYTLINFTKLLSNPLTGSAEKS